MKSNILSKVFLAAAISLASLMSSACWYNMQYYNDYIFGINNYENHVAATANDITPTTTDYVVKNNMVVDLPISISIKLDQNIVSETATDVELLNNMVYCVLQYRILPDGEWQNVAEADFQPNSIMPDMPPAFYLGRNNIYPTNCKKGDVIMVRLYVSRGQYQTGNLDSNCDKTLVDNKLKDSYYYSIDRRGNIGEDNNIGEDLGGAWLPQNVFTVVFSGNYRPIR